MTGPTDLALLADLADGSKAAFNELYDRHALTLFRWVRARENDSGAVEDLVQNVFFLLWKKRRSIVIRGTSVLPWLLVTARYEVMSGYRRRKSAPAQQSLIASPATVEDAVESRMLLGQVAVAVSMLPALDQDIFRLCLVEGYRYDEAALALGVAPGAVRNRLSRIRRGLIHRLGPLRSAE